MERILAKVQNVTVFLDDILMKEKTIDEIVKNTTEVLDKLSECGLKLKKSKCELLQKKINYSGLQIDENGIHALQEKIEAITKAPTPTNVTEL